MFISFLNKPFPPVHYGKNIIINNFFIGCFIALFLIVFKPFQIDQWQTENKLLKLAGFGVVSFVIPVLTTIFVIVIFQKKTNEDNWKVWHEITSIVFTLVFIAIGNLIYCNLLGLMPINLNGFMNAFVYTILIGFFPVAIHVMSKYNKFIKINTAQAALINVQLDKINSVSVIIDEKNNGLSENNIDEKLIFVAENEKDKVELDPKQFLYIESADNYSSVFFIEEGKVKKQMIRSSLKRLESQHSTNYIMRCHRTFIVNLKNVKSVEGNAAGYKLSFSHNDYCVPVSRSYGVSVIEKLKSL